MEPVALNEKPLIGQRAAGTMYARHRRPWQTSRPSAKVTPGFTLIELVLVIAILGVVAGTISLAIAPSEHRKVATELDRLASLFRLAQDEARISGQEVTWHADERGYRFLDASGAPLVRTPDDPLRARVWGLDIRAVTAPQVVFGREPLLQPAHIALATSSRTVTAVINAFGELTIIDE